MLLWGGDEEAVRKLLHDGILNSGSKSNNAFMWSGLSCSWIEPCLQGGKELVQILGDIHIVVEEGNGIDMIDPNLAAGEMMRVAGLPTLKSRSA
jgi:hypothetical protein